MESVEVTLTPVYAPFGIDHFSVFTPLDKCDFEKLSEAAAYATEIAERLAVEKAHHAGAEEVEVQVTHADQRGSIARGEGNDVFLGSNIKAIAVSKRKSENGKRKGAKGKGARRQEG